MENFVLFRKTILFALELRSNAVKVKIIASIISCRGTTIDITPMSANLSALIERRVVGTQETEILNLLR